MAWAAPDVVDTVVPLVPLVPLVPVDVVDAWSVEVLVVAVVTPVAAERSYAPTITARAAPRPPATAAMRFFVMRPG